MTSYLGPPPDAYPSNQHENLSEVLTRVSLYPTHVSTSDSRITPFSFDADDVDDRRRVGDSVGGDGDGGDSGGASSMCISPTRLGISLRDR